MTVTRDRADPDRADRDRAAAAEHLRVRDLSVRFRLPDGVVEAVTDVSLDLAPGTCLALVGESGCGKSVLVTALLGLLPANAEVSGSARLSDVELLAASEKVLAEEVRGRRIGLVPQSPASHLTPVRTVRAHLEEVLGQVHRLSGRSRRVERRRRADDVAGRAALPVEALEHYPHELSGGMAQRAVTALALAGDAWLLLADEPTTGLDRPLVDRTLAELRRLTDAGHAVLLVTHDLDAATRVADRVAVMYAGRIVETGPTGVVTGHPRHPYTRGLLGALPRNGFHPVPGLPPELSRLPEGCAFAPRCDRADDECTERPAPVTTPAGAVLACHHPC